MNRRTFALLLALLMLVSVAPRAVSAQATARPTISAQVGGKTVRGLLGSYCWPDDKGTSQCDVVDEPDPKSQIDVAVGGTISFIIDPAPQGLDSFKVVLLDDANAQGQPTVAANPTNSLDYTVPADLKTGVRRLQAQAVYTADAKGNQPFVYYAFLINVTAAGAATSQAIAAAPTNATLSATTNGAAPTSAATVAPSAVGTMAPSMVEPMTPAATVSVLGTVGAPAMTEPMTPAATTAPTASATSAAPTLSATEQATASATAAATDLSATAAPTEAATLEATITAAVPTEAATAAPTEVATVAPTQAATATPTQVATAAVPSLESTVPQMLLLVASNGYRPIAIESCKLDAAASNGQTCTSSAISANAPVPQAARDADVLFIFKGPAPDQTIVSVREADGVRIIKQQTEPQGNVILERLPAAPGVYILTVQVRTGDTTITYYFRVVVQG